MPQGNASHPTPRPQVHVPEGLTAVDLDIIKLTAQFVARNGKAFLVGLSSREHTNPQVGSFCTELSRTLAAWARVWVWVWRAEGASRSGACVA